MAELYSSPEMKKAASFFRRGNFKKVIKILEPLIFQHRNDASFFYFLGYSSLHNGNFVNGNVYLQRSLQLNPMDNSLFYGLALLHLKRGEVGDSVRLWLKILEQNPEDCYARAGMEFLKKVDNKNLQNDLNLKQCVSFLPGRDNYKKFFIRCIILGLGGAVLVAAAGIIFFRSFL